MQVLTVTRRSNTLARLPDIAAGLVDDICAVSLTMSVLLSRCDRGRERQRDRRRRSGVPALLHQSAGQVYPSLS